MPTYSGTNAGDLINGAFDNDTIIGWASSNAPGSFGAVTDDDVLNGFEGNDSISGGNGRDWITGGIGNDSLFGGTGNDTIYVGLGGTADRIDGGSGVDFLFLDRETTSIAVSFSIA
jgi:Ca2+-binding RTX toxin-like protein